MNISKKIQALVVLVALGGCEPACSTAQRAGVRETIGGVLHRVDVSTLLRCSELGATKEAARCLGAAAMTEGLKAAMGAALDYAERAQETQNPSAGAADMTALERDALAEDLASSMALLGEEIAATHS